jgi:predicted ATP-grasp superfamily ATP-dependent carboligase
VSAPALLLKLGSYPVHHGSVGAVRTLGRLGVPVYAIVEDRLTPTALSRYVRRPLVWPTTGAERATELVAGVLAIAEQLGARAVVIPTDDEAALLVSEHRDRLAGEFMLPAVPSSLPRRLATKSSLAELCNQHGVPTPACAAPATIAELQDVAAQIGFPVVLKNDAPWLRLANPAVSSSTLVEHPDDLARLAATWSAMPSVLVQEYIPRQHAQDWITHAYVGEQPASVVAFTGIKRRSWPPGAGVTAVAESVRNEHLATKSVDFCRAIGYRGIADLDWRLDTRDGRYRLLDFNPRVGAQFRAFETDAGIDVVRALYLDLTGQRIPPGRQIDGRYVVEHLAVPAAVADRRERRAARAPHRRRRTRTRLAWLAADDPLPALGAGVRVAVHAARRLADRPAADGSRSGPRPEPPGSPAGSPPAVESADHASPARRSRA